MYVAINQVPIVRGEMNVPAWGIWQANLYLSDASSLPVGTRAVLQIADISAACTVVRSVDWTGQRGVRVVGGFGGWRQRVAAKQYAKLSGLLASTVIQDTASLVGEQVSMLADAVVGKAWTREAAHSVSVLELLAASNWYMRYDGITVISAVPATTPRPVGQIAQSFTTTHVNQPANIVTVATENPAEWLPGKTFASAQAQGTIQRVRHVIDGMKLRTEVVCV